MGGESMMKHHTKCFFAGALVAGLALAQPPAEPVTVLKAAHLFDGASGQLSEPGVVVVRGQRIVAVGADAAIPADSTVIELGDATLMPGIIDAHTPITYDHVDNWAQGFYEGMLSFPVVQSFHAATRKSVA